MNTVSMKLLITSLAASLALTGCDVQTTTDDGKTAESVQTVKDGVLELDKSTTLGKAFDGYRYFSATVWTPTNTETGQKLIEAAGTVYFAKLTPKDVAGAIAHQSGVPAEPSASDPNVLNELAAQMRNVPKAFKGVQFVFQFILNLDDTFKLKGGKMNLVGADGKVHDSSPMNAEQAQTALKEIYEGHLPTLVLAILLGSGA